MLRRIRIYFGLVILGFIAALETFGAASAQSVAQSYNATTTLQPGVIVQLQSSSSNTVEALNQTNAKKMFGVVINPNDTTVTLSAPSSKQVFVATTGTFPVLVSNQDGAIKVGDYVTISSLDGIGMKATDSDSTVLGKATSAFAGTNDTIGSASLKNSANQTTKVELGRINVDVGIARNPLQKQVHNNLPSFLQSAGQSIASKPVSASRTYLSLAVLLISAIIAGSLLYAGVKNGIISIGRNPLSKKSIVKGLVQVTLTSLIVFIAGLFAVYLLLRY